MIKKIVFTMMLFLTPLMAEYTKPVKLPSISFPIVVDKGFPVMQRNCQWCHSFGYVLNQGKQSKEYWREVVVRMREVYKAPISKKDEDLATEYLFKNYGKAK